MWWFQIYAVGPLVGCLIAVIFNEVVLTEDACWLRTKAWLTDAHYFRNHSYSLSGRPSKVSIQGASTHPYSDSLRLFASNVSMEAKCCVTILDKNLMQFMPDQGSGTAEPQFSILLLSSTYTSLSRYPIAMPPREFTPSVLVLFLVTNSTIRKRVLK